ncbi:MAG: tetratricopeptide repeat protein [Promethearchaeota archaeon]
MSSIKPSYFTAIWESDFGVKIIESFPKKREDLLMVATNIFMAYHYFYKKDGEEHTFDRLLFNLELNNINCKARILLDSIERKKRMEPFIIVLLLPDFFPESSIKKFDKILHNISMEFLEQKSLILKKYYRKIEETFELEQKVQDSNIILDDSYDLTTALIDFKKGLELFQKKELDKSYFLLKKSNLKFQQLNQPKLILESDYIIASILAQRRKYATALEFYKRLELNAKQLDQLKYYEHARFMQSFCYYNEEKYENALQLFSELLKIDLKFIPLFQFYTLYGRTLNKLRNHDQALIYLEKALELSYIERDSREMEEKRAYVFIELGNINSLLAYQRIHAGKIDKNTYDSLLANSIAAFKEAASIWKNFQNFPELITTELLIAGLYEALNNLDDAFEHYQIALNSAEFSNDVGSKFYIYNQIIQILSSLGNYELLVKELDRILHETISIAFMDLFTIAGFHKQLGEALIKIGKEKEGLSELLIALNMYKKLPKPNQEVIDVLNLIVIIYKKKNKQDYIEYYQEEVKNYQERIRLEIFDEKIAPLEVVQEVWIFSNESFCWFSYSPQTHVNPELVSGFLSAMQNFGSELNLKEIKVIKIGANVFVYYRNEKLPFFIVGRTSMKSQIAIVKQILQYISSIFWEKYKTVLQDLENDPTLVAGFSEILENMEDIKH